MSTTPNACLSACELARYAQGWLLCGEIDPHIVRMGLALGAALLAGSVRPSAAQVSYSSAGSIYTQHFNTLADQETNKSLPYAWYNNVTLLGWYAFHFDVLGSALPTPITSYRGDDGTDLTGALYSYGTAGVAERALGSLASNSYGNLSSFVRFHNNTGKPLSSFTVTYTGEE